MAGSPGEVSETNGMPFYLSLNFLILGSVMLIPSVIVVSKNDNFLNPINSCHIQHLRLNEIMFLF